VAVEKGITDKNTGRIHLEYYFLLENNTTYAIDCGRDILKRKFANVFVTVRAEHSALVFMHTEIELGTMLYHRTVE
jgi:hypothetical protein